jgi:hypothetical protein
MTTTPAARPILTAPNGHHLEKGGGDTTYRGPLESLPAARPLPAAEAVARMYSDGYVLFPGVLSGDEVAALRALMDEKGGADDAKWEVKDWCYNRHQVTDFWQDPRLLPLTDRPGLLDTVRGIHDPGAHVTGGSFWTTGRGRAMGVHVDFLPVSLPESVHEDPAVRVPIFTSTAHFYLNDMTAELGPTTLIPGSHRAGRPPAGETAWRGITPKAAMVRAGDVCLFRGDLWHGAWMNSCETDRRYMVQVHYANGAIRKEYPAMCYRQFWNPDVVARATPTQKQLLGDRP